MEITVISKQWAWYVTYQTTGSGVVTLQKFKGNSEKFNIDRNGI
jgi:heme/copper-type cytochrome/quinol oxidase subunit 2